MALVWKMILTEKEGSSIICLSVNEKVGEKTMELYVHIPFCIKKCDYCDFLSFSMGSREKKEYVSALKRELQAAAAECEGETVSSVFLGGGTPSVLDEGQIEAILTCIKESYQLTEDCEISMEANPGTLHAEKLREYLQCGINRLSLGCQSTIEKELKSLGRIHSFEEFVENYEMARNIGFCNINVDLMSAIPGQDIKAWEKNLQTIAGLEPEHISAYSLIVEEGTPFYERELQLPSEEEERQMYEMTAEILEAYGFHQYEISNYAKKGKECRHNIGYWQRVDYLGVGLGASSLRHNCRFSNTRAMEKYLRDAGNPEKIRENWEKLSVQDQMEEFMFLGLRMTEGISRKKFLKEFGKTLEEIYEQPLRKLEKLELLETEGDCVKLTRKGISLSNQVFVEFLF